MHFMWHKFLPVATKGGHRVELIAGRICQMKASFMPTIRELESGNVPLNAEKGGLSEADNVLASKVAVIRETTRLSNFPAEAQTAMDVRLILEANGWGLDTAKKLQRFTANITPNVIVEVIRQLKNANIALSFLKWAREQQGYEHRAEDLTKIVGRLGRERDFSGAWLLLGHMKRQGVDLNYAFSIFIHRLKRAKMVDGIVKAMDAMKSLDVIPTVPLYTSALQFLLKSNSLGKVQRLYNQMLQDGLLPDKKLYELLIVGYSRPGKLENALILFYEMKREGYVPDVSIHVSVICCVLMVEKLEDGHELCMKMIESACALHGENTMEQVDRFLEAVERVPNDLRIQTCNNLLQVLLNKGKCDEATEVFSRMPGIKQKVGKGVEKPMRDCSRTLDTYKIFILGLCKAGLLVHASKTLREMLEHGAKPDSVTCSCLLLGLSNAKMMDAALHLSDHIMKLRVPVSSDAQRGFFSALRASGNLDRACKVFLAMRRKGCIDHDSEFVSVVGIKNEDTYA